MSIASIVCTEEECGAPQVIVLDPTDGGSWCAEHSPVIVCEPSHARAPEMEAALREIALLDASGLQPNFDVAETARLVGWQDAARIARAALPEEG